MDVGIRPDRQEDATQYGTSGSIQQVSHFPVNSTDIGYGISNKKRKRNFIVIEKCKIKVVIKRTSRTLTIDSMTDRAIPTYNFDYDLPVIGRIDRVVADRGVTRPGGISY